MKNRDFTTTTYLAIAAAGLALRDARVNLLYTPWMPAVCTTPNRLADITCTLKRMELHIGSGDLWVTRELTRKQALAIINEDENRDTSPESFKLIQGMIRELSVLTDKFPNNPSNSKKRYNDFI